LNSSLGEAGSQEDFPLVVSMSEWSLVRRWLCRNGWRSSEVILGASNLRCYLILRFQDTNNWKKYVKVALNGISSRDFCRYCIFPFDVLLSSHCWRCFIGYRVLFSKSSPNCSKALMYMKPSMGSVVPPRPYFLMLLRFHRPILRSVNPCKRIEIRPFSHINSIRERRPTTQPCHARSSKTYNFQPTTQAGCS